MDDDQEEVEATYTVEVVEDDGSIVVLSGPYKAVQVIQMKLKLYLRMRQERDMLGRAIADAAQQAGIYNGEVPVGGPMLLMLADDLGRACKKRESEV